MSSTRVNLTRGRPWARPRSVSIASSLSQSAQEKKLGWRWRTSASAAAGVGADQLDRRDQEAQGEPAGFARGLSPRVPLEDLHLLLRGPVLAALDRRAAQRVQLDFLRARGDVGVGQLAELLHLGIRE